MYSGVVQILSEKFVTKIISTNELPYIHRFLLQYLKQQNKPQDYHYDNYYLKGKLQELEYLLFKKLYTNKKGLRLNKHSPLFINLFGEVVKV